MSPLLSPLGKRLRHQLLCAALLAGPAVTIAQPANVSVDGPKLDVKAYVIDGELPLPADEVRRLVAPYVGAQRSLRDIEGAAIALETATRERGYPFYRMFVPAQRPVDGQVRLQVIAYKLGSVEITGNQHFSAENIRRSLTSLKEGEVPQVEILGRDVTASNNNPAKQIGVTFREGRQPATLDALVRVRDVPPMSFFATLTGNQSLSQNGPQQNTWRVGGVFQHSNLFDRDHVMTLSYTTDPGHISAVSLLGAYYQIPLYGTGMTVSGFLTYSDVNSGTVQQGAGVFDVSGSGRFAGIRLNRALSRVGTLQQTVGIGLEQRLFINSTTFNGVPLTQDVGSRVVSLQYSLRNEARWGDYAASAEYLSNIDGGPGNNAGAHVANGGSRNWDAWRFGLSASTRGTGWNYSGRLRAQYASKALISGEQFGLGGTTSVRGFADRAIAGETGLQWNLEALGPAWNEAGLKPVVFLEGGTAKSRATGTRDSIAAVGAGLRMTTDRLQVALDIAQVVDRATTGPAGHPTRLHFSLIYRF